MVLIRENNLIYLNLPDFLNTLGRNPENDKESTVELQTLTFKKDPTKFEMIRVKHNNSKKDALWKMPKDVPLYFKGQDGYFSKDDGVLVDLTEYKELQDHIREAGTMFADAYYEKRSGDMDMEEVDKSKLSVLKEYKDHVYLQLSFPKRSITAKEKEALRNGTSEILVHPKKVFYMDPASTKDSDYPVNEATYYVKFDIHNIRYESDSAHKKRREAVNQLRKELSSVKRHRDEEEETEEVSEESEVVSEKPAKKSKKTTSAKRGRDEEEEEPEVARKTKKASRAQPATPVEESD